MKLIIPKNRRKVFAGSIIFLVITGVIGILFTKWYNISPEDIMLLLIPAITLGWFLGRYDERRLKEGKWL